MGSSLQILHLETAKDMSVRVEEWNSWFLFVSLGVFVVVVVLVFFVCLFLSFGGCT